MIVHRLIAALLGLITLASSIPTITTKGSKFFTSDGDQFYVKGIAYQLTPHDPLLDTEQCKRDIALMKTLDANAIRVYHVEEGDHKGCMSAFADAGIYLFVDMDTFETQIEQNDVRWNETQYDRFKQVIDEFQQFDNTAGFYVGNEVITLSNGSAAAPYIKAATRDLKAYRDSKKYRQIPVGYSAADISSLRPMLQDYLACGTNASESIDFFSLNAYEWCGEGKTYESSGYNIITDMIKQYPVPIFFSETGCNTAGPRDFTDQAAIFGPQMKDLWSGSMVYEWIEEANNYGIVSYGPMVDKADPTALDGYPRSGTPMPKNPDFKNLKGAWEKISGTGTLKADQYSPSLTPPPCPARTPGQWEVNGDVPLPTFGQEASKTGGGGGSQASGSAGGKASGGAAMIDVDKAWLKGAVGGLVGVVFALAVGL